MKIWLLETRGDRNYSYLSYAVEKDVAIVATLDGKPVYPIWHPIVVNVIGDKSTSIPDFPYLSGPGLVVGERAREVLEPLIASEVEFLPLSCDQRDFWVINTIRVVNCMDGEKSEFTYWQSGNIRAIRKYVFDPECLAGTSIFRIPVRPKQQYVSDTFKTLVEKSHLEGIRFREVWEE